VLQAGVIHAVHSVARNVPVGVKSLDSVIGRSLSMIRVRSLAVEIFAALALLLAAVGVYGLTANWVQQRRSEIGIRLALGAQRRDIVTLIVGRVMLLTIVGLLAGIALAVPMTGMLRSFLFDVSPTDALTFIVAVSAILVSSLIASVVPLRHAVSVDPVVTLRYE
jgi:putative ABC transport system permease protein